ncbi:MAG: SDR family NAD(P)-dependent oxidoreductase, partial [Acetobacteraceae bacterium]
NRQPHSPLLSVDLWRRALHRAGFAPVEATAAPGDPEAASCPQVVLLASKVNAEAAKPAMASAPPVVPAAQSAVPATASDVEAMVRDRVAAGLDLPAAAIDLETPFGEHGVDSIVAPQIAEDINKVAGVSLRPTDLYNFATVRALAAHIAAKFPAARVASPAVDVVPDSGVVDQPVLPTVGPQTPPHPDIPDDAIAIIGMAGRFPDAPDLEAYWRNIAEGRSAVREIDRFDITPYFDPEPGRAGKTYAKWAATLADYDRFDPLFFSISPAEAEAMDPQQRLLLEEAWHALEDAGATPSRLDGARCGVFVGASANSYAAPASPSLQTLGGSMAILSARLSYFLNLKGPTFPVDTGCSSSLVALHLACQSLRTHESDMALAAGVSCNLLSAPIFFYLSDAGMASPVGQCKTFDDAADGFVPGEGVGVVVLKRLKDALRDGDRIQALVLGTGINQDGKTSGLTAPSATSQTELECAVYRQAGIDPATIGLIEAHGTGTRLGDPIEVAALTDAFAAFTPAKGFCAIGSVKTNIGHAMAAAGVAGLLKAVQALRHRTLPPSLNFSTPNRHIDFANSPFVVNTAGRTWDSVTPRRAAVSSFGFSGTNAHVVVQEAPPQVRTVPTPGPFLFVVSARSEAALTRRLDDLRQWLRAHPDLEVGDLAYTLAVRRAHFRHRRAFVADSVAGLLQALDGDVIAADAPAELGTLARRYRDGEPVDFGFLSGTLVDLPGYPFERERFWNPETKVAMADPGPARNDVAASWLTREHVIQGRRLLPGAAFLELARAAMRGGEAAVALRDVLWQAPVDATSGPTFVVTDVGSDGTCTLRVGDAAHATARIAAANPAWPASLDLAAIAARCTRRFDGQAVYAAAGGHGFAYGETYRVIRDVAVGEGEALAFLSAPPDRGEGWVWHPALLDGALQAASCIGLAGTTGDQPAFVPFALGSFAARHPLTGACAVHARRTGSGPDLMTFDIAICTQDGAVLAQARGLQARALTAPAAEAATLLYTPVWEAAPGIPSDTNGPVIACGTDAQLADLARVLPGRRLVRVTAGSGFARLDADRFMINPAHPDDHARLLVEAAPGPGATVALLWDLEAPPNGPSLAGAQEAMDPDTGPRALMAAAQAALRAPEAGVGRILYAGTSSPRSAAAAAFARTVGLESTRLSCSVLTTAATDIGSVARELCLMPDTAEILRRDGTRMGRGLAPMAIGTQAGAIAEGGVWVITGGAGAIGLALARHLARTRRPALILIGRSDLSPAQERTLAEIEALGADVLYLRADVTSGASLRTALDKARRRFGPITGVIHAAGILRDARIVQSEMADVDTVLRTKIAGAVALDHLTRDDPVSAFVLLSSTAAAFGSAGQGAYAAANGFLDGFAGWRSAQGRTGRTVSINWPLWRDGGMLPPQEVMAALARSAGLTPMPDAAALAAFEQVLATDATQVVVLHGNPPALRRFAGGGSPDTPARVPAQAAPVGDLRQRTEAYLRTVMSGVIKLAPERIDAAERFEAYGVDSMMIVRM